MTFWLKCHMSQKWHLSFHEWWLVLLQVWLGCRTRPSTVVNCCYLQQPLLTSKKKFWLVCAWDAWMMPGSCGGRQWRLSTGLFRWCRWCSHLGSPCYARCPVPGRGASVAGMAEVGSTFRGLALGPGEPASSRERAIQWLHGSALPDVKRGWTSLRRPLSPTGSLRMLCLQPAWRCCWKGPQPAQDLLPGLTSWIVGGPTALDTKPGSTPDLRQAGRLPKPIPDPEPSVPCAFGWRSRGIPQDLFLEHVGSVAPRLQGCAVNVGAAVAKNALITQRRAVAVTMSGCSEWNGLMHPASCHSPGMGGTHRTRLLVALAVWMAMMPGWRVGSLWRAWWSPSRFFQLTRWPFCWERGRTSVRAWGAGWCFPCSPSSLWRLCNRMEGDDTPQPASSSRPASDRPTACNALDFVAANHVDRWRRNHSMHEEADFAGAFTSYEEAMAAGGHALAEAWLHARLRVNDLRDRLRMSVSLRNHALKRKQESATAPAVRSMPDFIGGKLTTAYMRNGTALCGAYLCSDDLPNCQGAHKCAIALRTGRACGGRHPAMACYDKRFVPDAAEGSDPLTASGTGAAREPVFIMAGSPSGCRCYWGSCRLHRREEQGAGKQGYATAIKIHPIHSSSCSAPGGSRGWGKSWGALWPFGHCRWQGCAATNKGFWEWGRRSSLAGGVTPCWHVASISLSGGAPGSLLQAEAKWEGRS